ncbi:DHA2 family methylenomycin A resistance protein-like MFS transporter [Pedobacter cryoconitis]|uniref:DHA2 family methylenomycin A resistance protein-like MFS transporter n=1 Tax=Pedobacter cryoconitis TaxID=188932 RepID=A0A7W9DL27_9SPHI|nr:MFS transporter [Pedobacter cryoconitis]MBB5622852.1 DHA2 family methylenomycin A resistance protein-like MFS transporter [Pedobacter cryoconitis]
MSLNKQTTLPSQTPVYGWTIVVTSLAFVVAQLDVSIVNIALPQIADTYKVDINILQWIVDGYTLAFAVLMLSAGNLSDLFGAQRLFQIGMIIFGISSVACGLANSPFLLIAARVFQGVGAATMIPSSLAILNQTFADTPNKRAKAIGLWTAAGSAAIAAGPIVGGILIKLSNWRFIFFINAPICLAGILLTFFLKKQAKPTLVKKFDILGQVAWMLSITLLIAAVIEWSKLGFTHPLIYGSLLLGGISFIAFLIIENKVSHPMLPLSLFNSVSFNVLLGLGAVLNGFYYGTVFILSLYLQNILHYPPLTAGLAFLPLTAGFVISNLLSGNIINRYGLRTPILIGLTLFAFGFSGLFTASMHTSFWQLSIPFLLISLGMGLAVPAMTTGILSSVDKTLSGTASAALNTVRQAAGAIGVAVFGAIAANGGTAILHTITVSIIAAIVCTIVTIVLSQKYLKKGIW